MNSGLGHILLLLIIFILVMNTFLIITYTITAKRNKRMMDEVDKMAESIKKMGI